MARRVTWTNQSTDYGGTEVFRDDTIDPQNLPEPIATVGPVAQGATVEYIDTDELENGDYCYAVRDFDDSGESPLSDSYCITVGEDYSSAQVGDEIGGGIYAGTITYADAREYHIIFAKQSGEASGLAWSESSVVTGIDDRDDGKANTDAAIADSGNNYPAFDHCDTYSNDGFTDWYLPAANELALGDALVADSHPEFSTDTSTYRWTSTEDSSSAARARRWDSQTEANGTKTVTGALVRPIRRAAV